MLPFFGTSRVSIIRSLIPPRFGDVYWQYPRAEKWKHRMSSSCVIYLCHPARPANLSSGKGYCCCNACSTAVYSNYADDGATAVAVYGRSQCSGAETSCLLYKRQNLLNGKSRGPPYTGDENTWHFARAGTESQTSNHLLAEEMHGFLGRRTCFQADQIEAKREIEGQQRTFRPLTKQALHTYATPKLTNDHLWQWE